MHSTDSSRVNASLPLDSLSLKRAYFTRRLKFLFSQRDEIHIFSSTPILRARAHLQGDEEASSVARCSSSFPFRRGFHSAPPLRSYRASSSIREYLQKEYVNKPTEIFMLLLLYPRPFLIVPIVVIRLVDKYICAMHMRRCTRRTCAPVYRMFGNFRMFPNNPEIDIFLPTILQITITGVIVFYLFI